MWTIGDRLRKAREVAGIGVEEMAERLGRQRNSIRRWERSTDAQLMVVRLYAMETGVSTTWLLAGTDGDPDTAGVTVQELLNEQVGGHRLARPGDRLVAA